MDIAMPGLNGLEATRKIRKMLPKTEVAILSLHYSDQLVREVLDSGARAYILKSDASRDLLSGIDALINRQVFFTSGATQILLDGFCGPTYAERPALMRTTLSAREREIVQLLAEGRSSKEVVKKSLPFWGSALKQPKHIAQTSCASWKCIQQVS
jgi:DNA-binding NarL/FixJ family response regulator